jgi:DNA helicase-2/ATP-dependent DNA helicase PcrA
MILGFTLLQFYRKPIFAHKKELKVTQILDQLNEEQRSAVKATEGPVMVVAGAGSGKTRVLTYRIAYLLENGVDPFNILALTFTNKAAREMKERVARLVGPEARNVWMGTFHSVFARILRSDGHLLGYPSNFTIYDTDDSKSLIRTIVKELQLDKKVYTANTVLGRISSSKNNLINAQGYNNDDEITTADKAAGRPFTGKIYALYEKRLFQYKAMDFDDLLFKTNILLRDFPEILHKYQHKFHYILVDEYQDTNYSQYLIVKKLAANNENICVVGDDAQSIYAFRGANIANILNFKHDYPEVKLFKLEQNYRSTQNIVNAANGIIANNKEQIQKVVWTENSTGHKIPVIRTSTDSEEGRMIAGDIFETRMNEHCANKDFAILYRTNAQSRALEEALRKQNIPYRIYGGLSFYQRKEIKDLLAYFRLIINHNDEEALFRIINFPARGIGKTSQQKISIKAQEHDVTAWEVINHPHQYGLELGASVATRLHQFKTMIAGFASQLHKKNAYDLAKHIAATTGMIRTLNEDKTPEGISRFENLEELLNAINEFTNKAAAEGEEDKPRSLDIFMQDVALLTDQDNEDKNDTDKVSLMTVHAAKGLEFPFVYIVGLEENLFPSMQSLNTRADLEEERRLFYVALTRAEKKATLSYAETRYKWGNLIMSEGSRFLEEINEEYIDSNRMYNTSASAKNTPRHQGDRRGDTSSYKKIGGGTPDSSKFKKASALKKDTASYPDISADDIRPGVLVSHQRFGSGKVLHIEGEGPNKKATIFFKDAGEKNLLLKFARLKIIK